MTFGLDKIVTNCYRVANDFNATPVCIAIVTHLYVKQAPLN